MNAISGNQTPNTRVSLCKYDSEAVIEECFDAIPPHTTKLV